MNRNEASKTGVRLSEIKSKQGGSDVSIKVGIISPSAAHVATDYSALFDKERPMPVDVSLDSIRYRVGEVMGDSYADGPSECGTLSKSEAYSHLFHVHFPLSFWEAIGDYCNMHMHTI